MDKICQRNIIKVLNAYIEMSPNTRLYLNTDDSKMPLVSLSAPFLDDEHTISLSDYTGRCENYSLDPTGVITQSIDFNINGLTGYLEVLCYYAYKHTGFHSEMQPNWYIFDRFEFLKDSHNAFFNNYHCNIKIDGKKLIVNGIPLKIIKAMSTYTSSDWCMDNIFWSDYHRIGMDCTEPTITISLLIENSFIVRAVYNKVEEEN